MRWLYMALLAVPVAGLVVSIRGFIFYYFTCGYANVKAILLGIMSVVWIVALLVISRAHRAAGKGRANDRGSVGKPGGAGD